MFRPLPRLLAQGKERVTLALQMLNSHFPNERRIAMDALLKANVVSELAPLLKQWGVFRRKPAPPSRPVCTQAATRSWSGIAVWGLSACHQSTRTPARGNS